MSDILLFWGKTRYLSNFYIAPYEYKRKIYESVEHGYQAFKLKDPAHREMVRLAATPSAAKKLGGKLPLRDGFEEIKLNIMFKMVCEKFRQNPNLAFRLGETTGYLSEGNTWHDNFWGDCHCPNCKDYKGQNHLGRMIMQVRDRIQKGTL